MKNPFLPVKIENRCATEKCLILYAPEQYVGIQRDLFLESQQKQLHEWRISYQVSVYVYNALPTLRVSAQMDIIRFASDCDLLNQSNDGMVVLCLGSRYTPAYLEVLHIALKAEKRIINATVEDTLIDRILRHWFKPIPGKTWAEYQDSLKTHAPKSA